MRVYLNSRAGLRLLLMFLAVAALGWVAWLLWDALPALRANLPGMQVRWLLMSLLGNVVCAYLAFEAFRVLFEQLRPRLYDRPRLAHLYFTGQLMKHLPGRVWGVAYQSASGSLVSLSQWVAITAAHMAFSTTFALCIAGIVLGFIAGIWPGLVALLASAVALGLLCDRRPLAMVLGLLRRTRVGVIVRMCDALQPFVEADLSMKLHVLIWFGASWLVYLLAWVGYGLAWPGLTAVDGVWLCAFYTLAWFAGYVSFLTPSGIGIRELVFVLLARDFPADAIAAIAVLARMMLLLTDTVLGIAFSPYAQARKRA